MLTPLFGILVMERDPLQMGDLGPLVKSWLQDAGGFAAVGLLLWLLHAWLHPADATITRRTPVTKWMKAMAALALVAYAVGGGFVVADWAGEQPAVVTNQDGTKAPPPPSPNADIEEFCFILGGIFALLGLGQPFAVDLLKLRGRRIFALAKLSFKEAVRRKVMWVFLAFLVIFLFPPRWFMTIKPENEIRDNVSVIYWAMAPLLLVTAALLAAFGIPNDVKSQAIHTIVTKPVERFEIVVGRFLGYAALVTIVLFTMTLLSLLLLEASGLSQESKDESKTARVPAYGKLEFRSRRPGFAGESVGREWEYRRYIAGGRESSHRAIWVFDRLPSDLGSDVESVPLEFAFDIYRTTKGDENKGIDVSFTLMTWQAGHSASIDDETKVRGAFEGGARQRGINLAAAEPGDENWKKLDQLAGELGFFEFKNKQVFDYHTYSIDLPPALLRKALEGTPPAEQALVDGKEVERVRPRLRILVKCESPTQFIGVARYDLYLLAAEGSFGVNFFKGAVGLWFRVLLVIGLALACSTYLSGVISFLVALLLLGAGLFRDYIRDLAAGLTPGGGPIESFTRLVRNDPGAVPLDPTPTAQVAMFSDNIFRWGLRRFLNVVPDIERFDWTSYVAEGFNIPAGELFMTLMLLIGYLLPWGMLAYYLLRTREIAS